MKNIFCTISSLNYLAYTLSLFESYLKTGCLGDFFVLIVDQKRDEIKYTHPQLRFIFVGELGLTQLRALSFVYDIVEFNTAVKPTFLKFLLKKFEPKTVTYVDPDTYFYGSPNEIFLEQATYDILLTPHALTQHKISQLPGERMYLKLGNFNLGFISVSNTENTRNFLDWWEARCLNLCFSEPNSGLFVDQKWCNLVPILFQRVKVSHHFGLNMGNWNLHERTLKFDGVGWRVNSQCPLIFYHFSGFPKSNPKLVSKHTGDLSLDDRPDLAEIYRVYRASVDLLLLRFPDSPYSFGRFSDGSLIPDLARKLYLGSPFLENNESPFDQGSKFHSWLIARRLLSGPSEAQVATSNTVDRRDIRLRAIHCCLRIFSWLLGGTRYYSLMRYMAYISMPRNQGYVFFGRRNSNKKSIEFPDV